MAVAPKESVTDTKIRCNPGTDGVQLAFAPVAILPSRLEAHVMR